MLFGQRDVIERNGYPFEEYKVTTEDGYVLTLHRIPSGRRGNKKGGKSNKIPVLLQHGLASDSRGFLALDPEHGLRKNKT